MSRCAANMRSTAVGDARQTQTSCNHTASSTQNTTPRLLYNTRAAALADLPAYRHAQLCYRLPAIKVFDGP